MITFSEGVLGRSVAPVDASDLGKESKLRKIASNIQQMLRWAINS